MFRVIFLCSLLSILGLLSAKQLMAQSYGGRFYTIIQAGGIYGVQTSSPLDPMHGFQFHLVFGRNFKDKAFLGFGVGNDSYRGNTISENEQLKQLRLQTLPLFADFRVPLVEVGMLGRLQAFANAGYAPQLSEQYRQGALGKVGLSYEHLLADRSHLKFSVGYGVQQFRSRYMATGFYQQQLTLNIGLMVL